MRILREVNTLIQFSDGSSIDLFCFAFRKELLLDYDIRSSYRFLLGKSKSLSNLKVNKNKFSLFYAKPTMS